MKRSDKELAALCQRILHREYGDAAIVVNLGEFKQINEFLTKHSGLVLDISFVKTIEGEIFAQFSSLSPQHFLINDPKNLTLDDLDLLPRKKWYGPKGRSEPFHGFLLGELKRNVWALIVIFILSASMLAAVDSQELYDLLASLLIQGGTVFLSIYLIFTVAQSQQIINDLSLYAGGITHKYYRDDRNVTILALLTLTSIFLNAMFVYLILGIDVSVLASYWSVICRIIPALSTGLTIILLLDCFLSISQYYLSRTIDVYERDAVAEILHVDFTKHHAGDEPVNEKHN